MEEVNVKRPSLRDLTFTALGGSLALLVWTGIGALRVLVSNQEEGSALVPDIAGFHRVALAGEAWIRDRSRDFDLPQPHDAQRLSGCTSDCTDYDTGPVRISVYTVAGQSNSFSTFTSVAGLTVWPGHKLDELFLAGEKIGEQLVVHELQLLGPTDGRVEARIIRRNGDTQIGEAKQLNATFVRDPDPPAPAAPITATFLASDNGKMPIIAVKCPGGMCFVGKLAEIPTWNGQRDFCTAAGHCAKWGYFDAQYLGGQNNKGNLKRTGPHGLVIPLPGAALADDDYAEYQNVAAIQVLNKQYEAATFKIPSGGEGVVQVRETDGKWVGQITVNGVVHQVPVRRIPHPDREILAAARWKWSAAGEGIWVRCGAGCCEIELF